MGTKNIYQCVNDYLAKWDPIGLPQEIADVEYVDYVPGIVEALPNKRDLYTCLMSFLSKLGINQDDVRVDLSEEVKTRADELMKLNTISLSHEVYLKIIPNNPQKNVHSWYIAYDDENDRVCREVGIGDTGEVITKESFLVSHNCGIHSHLSIKDFIERFYAEIISKEEFEAVWNEELVKVKKEIL